MHQPHAQLKSTALLALEKFVELFTQENKNKILVNQRIDMSEMLKMDEYIKLNKALAALNKFIADNSTPKKEEKTHKEG